MTDHSKDTRTKAQLLAEIERLQFRLQEAEDALVVSGPQGEQVFSIAGAEHIYRVIVETMNEAALTVDPDGTILFCNQRFCDLMKSPIHEVVSRRVTTFVARPQQLTWRAADGTAVPVQLSASPLQAGETLSLCLVASDLTELEESAHSIR